MRDDEVIPVVGDEADELSHVDAPSSLDAQFDDLKRLEPGWFEPETPALEPDGLEAFRSFLDRALETQALPCPYIYPTPEAEARAEWTLSDWEVSATASFGERMVHVFATHLQSDSFEEQELDLSADDAPVAFVELIARQRGRQYPP